MVATNHEYEKHENVLFEHQISKLEWFPRDHATLKTRVLYRLKIQFAISYLVYYLSF